MCRPRTGGRAGAGRAVSELLQAAAAGDGPLCARTRVFADHHHFGFFALEKSRPDQRGRTFCGRTVSRRGVVGAELAERRPERTPVGHHQGIRILQPAVLRLRVQYEDRKRGLKSIKLRLYWTVQNLLLWGIRNVDDQSGIVRFLENNSIRHYPILWSRLFGSKSRGELKTNLICLLFPCSLYYKMLSCLFKVK